MLERSVSFDSDDFSDVPDGARRIDNAPDIELAAPDDIDDTDVLEAAAAAASMWAEPEPAPTADDNPLSVWRIDWPHFWAVDRTAADFLVEPLIPRGRGTSINSKGKAGKSLLLAEVAFAVATGRPTLHRPAGEGLTVVYLDMEMTESDLQERAIDFGYGPDVDLSRLHYILLPSIPGLDTKEGGTILVDYARDVRADLVIIDTTARAVEGPENDADTISDFHRHTGQPLKADGRTWVRLDHVGKDTSKGARGTSAKNDDVDLVWQMTRGDSSLSLKATHRRIAWVPETLNLAIVDEPHLAHRPSHYAWPEGTLEAAAKLDELDIPLDASKRAARDVLRAGEYRMSNDVLLGALRWRRERPSDDDGTLGTLLDAFPGTVLAEADEA